MNYLHEKVVKIMNNKITVETSYFANSSVKKIFKTEGADNR